MKILFLLMFLVSCGKYGQANQGVMVDLYTKKSIFVITLNLADSEYLDHYDFKSAASKYYDLKCHLWADQTTCINQSMQHLQENTYDVCSIDQHVFWLYGENLDFFKNCKEWE